jgi:hypothetical protein
MPRRAVSFSILLALAGLVVTAGCDGGSTMPTDGGPRDSGPRVDTGPMEDAGPMPPPPPDCTQPVTADVFTAPDGLPPWAESERGRLVRCGTDEPLSAATVDERARSPYLITEGDPGRYDGPTLTEGASVIRLLYRSERVSGEPGLGSGTLYLPADGTALPLFVHVSGTTGLGDACAPSSGNRFTDLERTIYVLIGRGQPVFVPDLMGLGSPGTLAYLEGTDAGRSVLDGARAALAAAPEGVLNGSITISGHSAGGHAALSAQALQRSYAPELDVLGVSAIGAVWFDTSVFATLLGVPGWSTAGDDGWVAVYGAMYFVGHAAAYDGEARAWDPLHPMRRAALRTALESYCLVPIEEGGLDIRQAVEMQAANVGEIFDPAFRSMIGQTSLCGTPLGCSAQSMAWRDRFAADLPTLDPEGAPIWFQQGELDMRSSNSAMGCPIARARFSGVDTHVCYYTGTEHGPLSGVSATWHADWIAALDAGADAPACPDPMPFPEPEPADCGLTAP